MAFRGLTRVGFRTDRHDAHQPYQTPDPIFVHQVIFMAQIPRHLARAVKRCLQELLFNPPHLVEVHLTLALWRIVK
jgi:hypothetical protein